MKHLSNLLLVIGIVMGALAAGGSKKCYREVELTREADLSGEFLFRDVERENVRGDLELLASAGDELGPLAVTRLMNAGVREVRVRRPARSSELLPVRDGALGHTLALPYVLTGSEETLPDGRKIQQRLLDRAHAAGHATVSFRSERSDAILEVALPYRRESRPPGETQEARRDRLDRDPIEKELALDLTLPRRLEAGVFLEETRVSDLAAAGLEEVAVAVHVPFEWSAWSERWGFVLAVVLMLIAVVLKRAAPSGPATAGGATAGPQAVREALEQLVAGVGRLVGEADSLDAEALHHVLDPLLTGPCLRVAEERDALRVAYGLRVQAGILASFAAGERKLNRAWSASVDGAIEEARDCVHQALPPLQEALSAFPAA